MKDVIDQPKGKLWNQGMLLIDEKAIHTQRRKLFWIVYIILNNLVTILIHLIDFLTDTNL